MNVKYLIKPSSSSLSLSHSLYHTPFWDILHNSQYMLFIYMSLCNFVYLYMYFNFAQCNVHCTVREMTDEHHFHTNILSFHINLIYTHVMCVWYCWYFAIGRDCNWYRWCSAHSFSEIKLPLQKLFRQKHWSHFETIKKIFPFMIEKFSFVFQISGWSERECEWQEVKVSF